MILLAGILSCMTLNSCMKEWLDVKTDKKLVIPQTLNDLQAILDNTLYLNYRTHPSLSEISADDYVIEKDIYDAFTKVRTKNAFVWKSDIFEGASDENWNVPYQRIYYANVVLDLLNDLKDVNKNDHLYNAVKGGALFFRADSYFNLVDLFCDIYDESTADRKLGLPLKIESDVNINQGRSSLKETYVQIITDLKQAASLLPQIPLIKSRPSKPAAYGLLARVYLQAGDYKSAFEYADSCLLEGGDLLDFNNLNATLAYPIPKDNKEVLFSSSMISELFLRNNVTIDEELFRMYDENDLRKSIFFENKNGKIRFKGTYEGDVNLFTGISKNEIYLILSECAVRLGDKKLSLLKLNELLSNRYISGSFNTILISDSTELLRRILLERRKELIGRGVRWRDLRRLNKEDAFAKTLYRNIGDDVFSLPPNDKRYVMPIPEDVIRFSGIEQNVR